MTEMHKPPYPRFRVAAGVLGSIKGVARIETQDLVIQVNGGYLPSYAKLEDPRAIQGENCTYLSCPRLEAVIVSRKGGIGFTNLLSKQGAFK